MSIQGGQITENTKPSWMSSGDASLFQVFQATVTPKAMEKAPKTPQQTAQEQAYIITTDTDQSPNQHVKDSMHTTIKDELGCRTSRNGMTYGIKLNEDTIEIKGNNNDSKVTIRITENKNDPMISNIDVSGKIDPMLMKKVLSDINGVVGEAGIKAGANDSGRIGYGTRGCIDTRENKFFSRKEQRAKAKIEGEKAAEAAIRRIASDVIKEKNPEKAADIRMSGAKDVTLEPWMKEIMKHKTFPSGSFKVAGDVGIVGEAMGVKGLSQSPSSKMPVSSPKQGV